MTYKEIKRLCEAGALKLDHVDFQRNYGDQGRYVIRAFVTDECKIGYNVIIPTSRNYDRVGKRNEFLRFERYIPNRTITFVRYKL